ncbi:MAG: sugar phosphate isomerase/epimerase [bacterium]|nr:sugar phosphate isomerase/epimerase [bacterium]
MNIGVSSSCLYPEYTEQALDFLGSCGVDLCEIFINSCFELNSKFVAHLKSISDQYQMRISSIHPMASFAEPYMLFSVYERRFKEGLEFYKRYFEVAAQLGAKYIIIHGCNDKCEPNVEQYCERFNRLIELGRPYGVMPLQENVNRYSAADPEFIDKMKKYLGKEIRFTFDVKQAVRSGFGVEPVLKAMGDSVAHVHISDHDSQNDCLLPGDGCFDFGYLFEHLTNIKYTGDCIIEVYNNAYKDKQQIINSYLKIK